MKRYLLIACLAALGSAEGLPADSVITLGPTGVDTIQIAGMGMGAGKIEILLGACAQTIADPCELIGIASDFTRTAPYKISTPVTKQPILRFESTISNVDHYIPVPSPTSLDFIWGPYLNGTLDLLSASQAVPGNGYNEHPPLVFTARLNVAGGNPPAVLTLSVNGNQRIKNYVNTTNTMSGMYLQDGTIRSVSEPASIALFSLGLVVFVVLFNLLKKKPLFQGS